MHLKERNSSMVSSSDLVLKRYDKIIQSEEDKRSYRGLVLSNHMKVLLVSDPNTDKSAAAMDVNVGTILLCLNMLDTFLLNSYFILVSYF